jgi:hypothetical protein
MRYTLNFLLPAIGLMVSSCVMVHTLQTRVPTSPVYTVNPESMLVLSTFDATAENFRKNKSELFAVLTDKLILDIAADIKTRIGLEPVTVMGLTRMDVFSGSQDSAVVALMEEKNSTDAILITYLNVRFDRTGVEVTRDEDGSKSREAYYDIVSTVRYHWYTRNGLFLSEEMKITRFHSSRVVFSGLFAAGPNVVKKKKDAFSITEENMHCYLNLFLPGYAPRSRPIYTGREFKLFKLAIDGQDYETALLESIQYIDHPNRKVAARAHYNCAVMYERLGQYDLVKQYLDTAFRLHYHPFPSSMLEDYY